MQQLTLHERIDNWAQELSIDGENRVVRNVALAGPLSRNGYRYSEEALQGAVHLYENRPVFLDHANQPQRPLDRSTRDLVGTVINSHFSQGRVRGDIRVLDTESGQTFLKLVEAESPGVGMSHVVLAQRNSENKTVDKIVDVISVDVVINPATTSTFRESTEHRSLPDLSIERIAQLEQHRDELLEQNRILKQKLDEIQIRERVQKQLIESGLPVESISECFHEQLVQAGSEQIRLALIEDRLRLLNETRQSGRVFSHERTPVGRQPLDKEQFLQVLRRSN